MGAVVLIEDDSWINSLIDAKPRAFWFAPTYPVLSAQHLRSTGQASRLGRRYLRAFGLRETAFPKPRVY